MTAKLYSAGSRTLTRGLAVCNVAGVLPESKV